MLASPPMPATVSPIMDALYHGRADEAQRLVDEAGPASLTIHEAAAMGVVPRIEQLLAEDADAVNAWAPDGFQPLQLAAFFGRREAAELLLARGGDVQTAAQNSFKVTALHAALAGSAQRRSAGRRNATPRSRGDRANRPGAAPPGQRRRCVRPRRQGPQRERLRA
jgi:hypothetical protein